MKMIKKLMAMCAVLFTAFCVYAETETVNGIEWTYTVTDGKASIDSGSWFVPAILESTSGAITIPSTLGGYPVTSIGGYAFYFCYKLTSVTIPNSVTSIGRSAFVGCYELASITIPNSVISIHQGAFSYCKKLQTFIVGRDNVSYKSVDGLLFSKDGKELIAYPGGRTRVNIPDGVTSIGGDAFSSCSSLTSIAIPNSVTNIGDYAFYNCDSLTSITIPDSVTSIGDWAFYCCSSLTSVTILDSVMSIGEGAFSICKSLTSVTIPNSVTSISRSAFSYCDLITSVTIPDSVMSIGDRAFFGCDSLTNVTIPDSVMSIGFSAFNNCESLKNIIVDEYNNYYKSINGLLLSKDGMELVACPGALTSVTIPNSVTSIGEDAFSECSLLTSVIIPDSVMYIGDNAFKKCESLINVIFRGNAPESKEYDIFVGYDVFVDVHPDCTVYVNPSSTGWGVDIPGKWSGLNIKYITSMPEPTPQPQPKPEVTPNPELSPKPEPTPTPTPTPNPNKPELGNGNYDVSGDKLVGAAPKTAASIYDGYLYLDNVVMGTIQAKVAKPKKGVGKLTVAIQITGEKKLTLKGELDLDIGEFTATDKKSDRTLILKFGLDGITGTFGKYDIDGARNLFDSKDKSEKSTAEEILKSYLGAYSMILDGGILSVTIAKKGKVTIKGAIDGNKVSLKAQALIGEKMICIPVIYSKKSVNLAFTIWLPINGGDAVIVGLDDAIIGKAGTLKNGAKFIIDGDIGDFIETEDPRTLELLPDNETITVSKSKWLVADGIKPAKVAYKKGEFTITEGKKGAGIVNPSGLKLSYKSKDGSFTGSFTAYAIVKGKLKKHKATVEGILIGDVGYGTITIKKIGTWAVTIE